jgi:hypothetical protein
MLGFHCCELYKTLSKVAKKGILLLSALASLGPACGWTNTNLVHQSPSKLSDSRKTMAPDGTPAWAVACTRSMSECYDECARVCPRGYEILDKNEEGYASRSHAVAGDGWAHARTHASVERIAMLISCRSRSLEATNTEDEDPPMRRRPH